MLEVLKLFAHDLFFNKFGFMIQEQQKYNYNILDLFEPQKTDETNEFESCFKKILENIMTNRFFPIQIDESEIVPDITDRIDGQILYLLRQRDLHTEIRNIDHTVFRPCFK